MNDREVFRDEDFVHILKKIIYMRYGWFIIILHCETITENLDMMKKQKRGLLMGVLMSATAMFGFTSCSSDTPGALEDQPAAVAVKTIQMTAFSGGQQNVTGLEDGLYSLEFFAKGSGTGYVEAGGKRTALVSSPEVLKQGFVRGIEVNGGTCAISIHGEDAAVFSNMRLVKNGKPFSLLKGGDISMLTYAEQNGAKYHDEGKQGDCVEILKANGMNLVRLRLYNEPGKYPYRGYSLEPGIQDEADILALAKRAKAAGMQILLTFHYSDFWTNGEDQFLPHSWEGKTADEVRQSLYDFTHGFMEKMKSQGTTPEYVSLGNETQAGMLYPLGGPLTTSDADYMTKVKNVAAFYNAGYEAVKSSSPDTKVIIHLHSAGDKDLYNWYFGLMNDWNVQYDIIGASYYPFWTGRDAKSVCEWAEYTTNKFDKDLIFMEVGYAWQQKIHDGVTDGQLSHNWPYTDLSQEGQKNFMLELTNEIKKVGNGRVLGYSYWDPIFIPAGTAGWAVGQVNAVSNSALFDFDGNALPVFDAFRNNN